MAFSPWGPYFCLRTQCRRDARWAFFHSPLVVVHAVGSVGHSCISGEAADDEEGCFTGYCGTVAMTQRKCAAPSLQTEELASRSNAIFARHRRFPTGFRYTNGLPANREDPSGWPEPFGVAVAPPPRPIGLSAAQVSGTRVGPCISRSDSSPRPWAQRPLCRSHAGGLPAQPRGRPMDYCLPKSLGWRREKGSKPPVVCVDEQTWGYSPGRHGTGAFARVGKHFGYTAPYVIAKE